jgi:hypothetical protein
MVPCDAIWTDPATGKRTILGCFSVVCSAQFPVVYQTLTVYTAITDSRGKVPLTLQLVDSDDHPLASVSTEVEFTDPRQVIEIDFHFGEISIAVPGE